MTDAFQFFALPRRPWLDSEGLKDEFHRRSAQLHPDAGGEAGQFAELNAAYQLLRDPVARLRHLLELEAPAELARSAPIPPSLAETFMRVASVRQRAERLLEQQRAASSLLARALLTGEYAVQFEQLTAALATTEAETRAVLDRVQALDATWREALPELARAYAEVSYLAKWTQQLRDLCLQMELAR